jgi:ATP-dependent Clp protease ATP-binding subunit ClpA
MSLNSPGRLAPLIGRERELGRLIHILVRRSKNSAFPVGEPGVGKTVLVEGLAVRIASATLPMPSNRRLVSIDAVLLSSGSDRYQTVRATVEVRSGSRSPRVGLAFCLGQFDKKNHGWREGRR